MECHCDAVHAVSQSGRLRSVVEQMPEMAAAAAAMHGRADHAVGMILGSPDCAIQRCPETWPTSAAVEFRLRRKGVLLAAGAGEIALALLVQQRTGKRIFG